MGRRKLSEEEQAIFLREYEARYHVAVHFTELASLSLMGSLVSHFSKSEAYPYSGEFSYLRFGTSGGSSLSAQVLRLEEGEMVVTDATSAAPTKVRTGSVC